MDKIEQEEESLVNVQINERLNKKSSAALR